MGSVPYVFPRPDMSIFPIDVVRSCHPSTVIMRCVLSFSMMWTCALEVLSGKGRKLYSVLSIMRSRRGEASVRCSEECLDG